LKLNYDMQVYGVNMGCFWSAQIIWGI